MQTGQYYFNHFPERIQQEFKDNCIVRFDYVMNEHYTSVIDMIDDAFGASFTKQGRAYWLQVAENHKPTVAYKANTFIDRNKRSIIGGMAVITAMSLAIAIYVCDQANSYRAQMAKDKKELSRRDSIIHAAERIDSIKTDMIGQRPSFDEMRKGWEFKGAITTDSVNSWMDRIMSENKVRE